MLWLDAEEMVGRLNRKLTGWANYFCLGPVSKAYRAIDTAHCAIGCAGGCARSTRWRARGRHAIPTQYLHEQLGLVRLAPRTHDLPWAKA